MKLDTKDIINKLSSVAIQAKRYSVFIFIVAFLSLYVFLVSRIGQLIESEIPQTATEATTKPISRLKVDKQAAEHMEQLESQNIEVQTLFNDARQNPFAE